MNLLIYPTSKNVQALIRYSDLVTKYSKTTLCAPKGWCKENDDFSVFDRGTKTGNLVHTDLDKELSFADAVYFPESPVPLRQKYIQDKIIQAVHLGKFVYLDCGTISEIVQKSLNITVLHGEEFIPDLNGMVSPEICKIPIPIVFVMGLGPQTGKFMVQLALRKFFLEKGYRISQVGSSQQSRFFGFNSIPDVFFSKELSIREKIIGLNRYFYTKYISEKPEIMIIGLPGGIMPLSAVRFEELGEMAYLISQAISPDCAILCSYAVNLTNDIIDNIKAICRYRLGVSFTNLVITNTAIELSLETRSIKCDTIDLEKFDEKYKLISANGLKVFDGSNSFELAKLAECVYEELI